MKNSTDVHKKGVVIAEIEASLVKYIRASGGLSRIELADALTIAPSTVGVYVDRLIREGFLFDGQKKVAGVGRPRTSIMLNPSAGQFIGVDFHADEILAVLMDFAQNPITQARTIISEEDSVDDVVDKIFTTIGKVEPSNPGQLLGIGIGSPGPVDRDKGIALEYRYIRDFKNIPLVAPVSKKYNVPVYIENTTNAMALAELWFGQGRDLGSFVCLWIRSGIGAGVIVNRQLYSGQADGAGEIGFLPCPVYDGGLGGATPGLELRELEEIASIHAIRRSLKVALEAGRESILDINSLSTENIVVAYRSGDTLVRQEIDIVTQSLGWAIANLSLCMAPERVILAGPLAVLGDDFLKPLKESVFRCFANTGLQLPHIVMSSLGPFSGAIGAASLVVDKWKPVR